MDALFSALQGTYIKNDYGELRALYVLLCLKAGLHEDYPPEAYKWTWVWCDASISLIQQAPDRRYIKERRKITLEELTYLYYQFVKRGASCV